MTDDGGVLGNLPRSRPGQRSHKRAATPREAAKPSRPAPKRAKPPVAQEAKAGGSAVGDVVRAVTSLAAGGVRLAGGTAREVLRRLPRP